MKTTVLFRMMVLVAMVVAGIANTELKAQDNNFITNEEKVDDLVVSKVIYRLDGSLYRHMKYDFTYDDQKRVTAKEAFKWDSSTEKWIPYFKIDYTYSSNEITLVYARWILSSICTPSIPRSASMLLTISSASVVVFRRN